MNECVCVHDILTSMGARKLQTRGKHSLCVVGASQLEPVTLKPNQPKDCEKADPHLDLCIF